MKTLVLERRPVVGGAAITGEVHPGFRVSTLAHAVHPAAALLTELQLGDHGLQLVEPDPSLFAPLADGRGLVLGPDEDASAGKHREILRSRRAAVSGVLPHAWAPSSIRLSRDGELAP